MRLLFARHLLVGVLRDHADGPYDSLLAHSPPTDQQDVPSRVPDGLSGKPAQSPVSRRGLTTRLNAVAVGHTTGLS